MATALWAATAARSGAGWPHDGGARDEMDSALDSSGLAWMRPSIAALRFERLTPRLGSA
ncbi:MAG TPA: hypothetical protein VMW56_01355 [Candidatus Margulisiibacteriota bacterium]|nr:hypothetical protein [Candidatus Margulisiibacteriota bacterium]